jgi:hypothetical protein
LCPTFTFKQTKPTIMSASTTFTSQQLAQAARNGDVERVNSLIAAGCPLSEDAIRDAAHAGHLDCIKQLVAAGCPMDFYALGAAASQNQPETLQFLYECDPEAGKRALKWATEFGYNNAIEALNKVGCL